jgi:prevent-host-death family protein
MERIGVRELRQHASRYLDRVKSGESLEVTERGVPIAVLTPVPAMTLSARMIALGTLIPPAGPLTQWLEANPAPEARRDGSPRLLTDSLTDLRDEEEP